MTRSLIFISTRCHQCPVSSETSEKMSVRSVRSVHTSKSLKENTYIDISCSDNSSQYQSVSINTVEEEDENVGEMKVKNRRASDKTIDETCNKMDSVSLKCSNQGLVNNSLRSSERKVPSKNGTTKQRKSSNAKYHTLPVSSGKNRSSNTSDNGNKGSTLVHSSVSSGTNATVKSKLALSRHPQWLQLMSLSRLFQRVWFVRGYRASVRSHRWVQCQWTNQLKQRLNSQCHVQVSTITASVSSVPQWTIVAYHNNSSSSICINSSSSSRIINSSSRLIVFNVHQHYSCQV